MTTTAKTTGMEDEIVEVVDNYDGEEGKVEIVAGYDDDDGGDSNDDINNEAGLASSSVNTKEKAGGDVSISPFRLL